MSILDKMREIELAIVFHNAVSGLGASDAWQKLERFLVKFERKEIDSLLNTDAKETTAIAKSQGMLLALRLIRNVPRISASDRQKLQTQYGELQKKLEPDSTHNILGADPEIDKLLEELEL